MPSSPKVSAAVEAKEQTSAQELPEGGMQVQKSPEPEILSTQEDLFDQSNKTGTKNNQLPQLFFSEGLKFYFCSEATDFKLGTLQVCRLVCDNRRKVYFQLINEKGFFGNDCYLTFQHNFLSLLEMEILNYNNIADLMLRTEQLFLLS